MWGPVAVSAPIVGGVVYAAASSQTNISNVGTIVAVCEAGVMAGLYLMGKVHPNSAMKAKDAEIERLREAHDRDNERHREDLAREREQHRADVTALNEKVYSIQAGIGEASVKAVTTNSLTFEQLMPMLREALAALASTHRRGGT